MGLSKFYNLILYFGKFAATWIPLVQCVLYHKSKWCWCWINEGFCNGILQPQPHWVLNVQSWQHPPYIVRTDQCGRYWSYSMSLSMQDLWILEQLIVKVGGGKVEFIEENCAYLFDMFFQTLLKDEENQIRGFTYVFDCSGLTLSHLSIWTPQECSRVLSICEKNLPMRHKDINLLNLPFPMWAVFEFCKTLLSDKIRKRFSVLGSVDKLVSKMGTGIF